jgi:hypothetical protein
MTNRSRKRSLRRALAVAAATAAFATGAQATTFRFDTDPFAGSTALQTPGRQIVGGELFIAAFDLDNDRIEVTTDAFDIEPTIATFAGFAADLPDAPFNFIVLRTLDADGDPLNGNLMNAGLAANLIAGRLSQAGAGFFMYFNSGLNLTRLVYSTDLSSPTADLKVIARFQDQVGQAGVDVLARGGVELAAVPEPATWSMMIAGFGLIGGAMRRVRRFALVA